jgi:hypothetical protein
MTMNTKAFETLLDRLGTDFDTWPAEEAGQARTLLAQSEAARKSYAMLRQVESWIDASRPRIAPSAPQAVVRRALADIAVRDSTPTPLERFRQLLLAPLPRAAFAISLAALGFAVGIATGNPSAAKTFDTSGNMLTASVDDVLF